MELLELLLAKTSTKLGTEYVSKKEHVSVKLVFSQYNEAWIRMF